MVVHPLFHDAKAKDVGENRKAGKHLSRHERKQGRSRQSQSQQHAQMTGQGEKQRQNQSRCVVQHHHAPDEWFSWIPGKMQ
eukprot:CAMPEP_0114573648 /NCGR_PEP_ID=MMETSP0114-20121206/18977_1 /TAXON_ID=31324 /ORGANISM="Goniomonas sp, Strain m" /LENGTH=80 /DNA_ID=CAMNT_0001761019 /DNA_START=1050 /DNA_END=1289 /DNA_ORIENTATION=-